MSARASARSRVSGRTAGHKEALMIQWHLVSDFGVRLGRKQGNKLVCHLAFVMLRSEVSA
ncbi:MAG: hypothetical protein WA231_07015 [Methylocella sp.]